MAEGRRAEFLFLNEEEMIRAGVLDSERCVDVLDEMFQLLGRGDYIMGGMNHNEHGIRLSFPKEPKFSGMPADGPDRRFMAMVAYLGGRFHVCGEKWYGSNVANPSRGLPRSVLMIMLNDPDTCVPIALMSANLISAIRTGSVPGVGARYLAKKNAEVIGLIGAGPIQKACLQGIMVGAKNAKQVRIFDINPDAAGNFTAWAKEKYHVDCVICNSMEEAVSPSDIISSAASRLHPVTVRDKWLKKGSLIMFTGAGRMEESYFDNAKVFFDNAKMHAACMDDAHRPGFDKDEEYKKMMGGQIFSLIDAGKMPPIDRIPSLGDCACGNVRGRENDDERIYLMTYGMAIEDVAWSFDCLQRAKKLGLGTKLKIWDSPHWF